MNEGLINPWYMAGLLEASFGMVGVTDGAVKLLKHTSEGATYELRL